MYGVLLLAAWSLASCGPRATAPTPVAAPAATHTPQAASQATARATSPASFQPAATPSPLPTWTATATPVPSATLTRPPSRPLSRTPSPTPSPTPWPTLPPLSTPGPGEPLALSLGWQFGADGHLAAGRIAHLAGQPLLLLASLGRTVTALDEDGALRWQARVSGPAYALAFLDDQGVAIGDDAGRVTLFDLQGHRLWAYDLGSRVTALDGWQGGVLAGGWDERLTLLDAAGAVRWQVGVGGPVTGIAALPGAALAATLDGRLCAFDPGGNELWCLNGGAPLTGLGILDQGASVLAGTQDGRLLALDATGSLRWQQELGTGGPVWHVTSLAGDPVIVAGTGGEMPTLVLLSTAGQVLWRIGLPSPVGAVTALDLDGDGANEILAGLASGEVRVYDAQGQLRASVHAGLPVWGLEAAGRGSAFVLADVLAWRLVGRAGERGAPWLSPPAMLPDPPDPLPGPARAGDGQATLVFLGDVAPARTMEAQLLRYGPAYPWAGLRPLLRDADLAVANLESALTTQGQPLDKPYLVRAHPRWGQTLVEGGIDLVTLANNHVLDYGPAGLDETLDTLGALDIAAVGAGRSPEEAVRPALADLDGVRVAVLDYAASRWDTADASQSADAPPPPDIPPTDRLAWAVPEEVQAAVRAARDQADVVVVVLHAGTEYAAAPSPDQVAVAHAAIDAGADLVVGHHPHVTQTVERYRDGLIVYSLGDALFDIPRQAAMLGHLLRVYVTREGLVRAELWPFWIDDAIRPRLLDDGQGGPSVRVIYP
jgi:poly-gamma-glutamate capsule biosynthesis protein CapA/YwtB (metallophosphatase superfamily)/outer membrane protein assembly factor BamB